MKKLLNTLYVTTPESYLAREGLNLLILIDNTERFRIPIHNLESVVTFGYSGMSPGAMQLCMEHNVGVCFLSPQGRLMGRVSGPIKGNVLLRKIQYECCNDPSRALPLACNLIFGKITNYRSILQRRIRDYGPNDTVQQTADLLNHRRKEAFSSTSFEELRGIEGDAAKNYFGTFNALITPSEFHIEGRNRRPPKDRTNALLSFCYTLLMHDVQNGLETVGLDPYYGLFHTLRPGRPSLALDLMEELRAYIVDRFVIALINRQQIKPNDFINHADQSFLLTDDKRRELLTLWWQRKKETITHPYLDEKIELGLLPYVQAMLLARHLRGDLDNYPVFLSK